MSVPTENEALELIPRQLAALLGIGVEQVNVEREPAGEPYRVARVDLIIEALHSTWVVAWRASGSLASVAGALERLPVASSVVGPHRAIPLLVVPYMGSTAAERCEDAGIAWMDLSGNAHIEAPGMRIHVEGKPNQYTRRGRPSNVFAPKSSRVARFLLRFPDETFLQREIAEQTGLSEGYTSRIISRLEDLSLVYRDNDGRVGAYDPALLLDAWAEKYQFDKHRIRRGIVTARSGQALLQQVAEVLEERGVDYAATGLAGAWVVDPFASFRTVTFYLRKPPEADDLEALRFHEGERGSNLWLVSPNDEGVFQGAETTENICHVHPVQLYVDLQQHPERSAEAAEHLRREHLK